MLRDISDVVLPDVKEFPTTPLEMANVQAIKLLRQLQSMQDVKQGSIFWNDISNIGSTLMSIAKDGRG
jgi:hypothetical protein|tara:strand:- start:199 stop:402 length:204 start_codon:yes stop_codon:yes gene_type:complete